MVRRVQAGRAAKPPPEGGRKSRGPAVGSPAGFDNRRPVMNTGRMETIGAADFKAHCLAILDRVRATGERVVILKRGAPVAELGPVASVRGGYPQSELRGTARVLGDIVAPAAPEGDWESLAR